MSGVRGGAAGMSRALEGQVAVVAGATRGAGRGIARMLGEAHGSGYTEGVPYLRKCLDNRLFWRLADYLEGSKVS